MAVLEPPEDEEAAKIAEIEREADGALIPDAVPEARPSGSPIKDVCKHCMRPLIQVTKEDDNRPTLNLKRFPSGWCHLDGRIDQGWNVEYHIAELFVEAPIPWGFLNTRGKSDFRVDSGPSKVRSGWSGGGVS